MNVLRYGVLIALLATLGAAPPADPMQSLAYLVGSWTCSYQGAGPSQTYVATFRYDLGKSWLWEHDSWAGGGGEDFYTYEPKAKVWSMSVFGQDHSTTMFHAADTGGINEIWRSIYPDTSMTVVFNKLSSRKYTLHYTQVANGKTTTSADVCVKA